MYTVKRSKMAIVVLDIPYFKNVFPQFATASDESIEMWWQIVENIIDNTLASRIAYKPESTPQVITRKTILYTTLCHVGTLNNGEGSPVGRVSSAGEGSISASLDYGDNSKNSAWWIQSQCGATAWQLLKPFRTGGLYFGGGCYVHPR